MKLVGKRGLIEVTVAPKLSIPISSFEMKMSTDFSDRNSEEYRNLSARYAKRTDDYNKQYYRIYLVRLDQMTKYLLHEVQKKWGDEYPICKLHRMSEESYDKCVVIGTLFKDQKLKPSVLKQLADSNSLVPQPIVSRRTDGSDVLHIEDELQRFELAFDAADETHGFDPRFLVTGVTCALLGSDIGQGRFRVADYAFAGYRSQIDRPIIAGDSHVVLMSGLDLINAHKYGLKLKLLVDWISGFLGTVGGVDPAKITRIILAGNSVKNSDENTIRKFTMTTRTNQSFDTIEAVKTLDALLLQLCQVIEVDVMPGQNDPSNHVLPQKPLHHCLLPKSVTYRSLRRVTNPYECEISGTRLLGTSGQPPADVLRYSDVSEPADALESCLRWGHVAPTAPDTLGCFPYYDEDPFVIDECPHVLFAGNQEKFDTRLARGQDGQTVRIICIPAFSVTSSVCVLNLKTLECSQVVFG